MKTNQFENTIRRKLESIQPDFQEQDWAKMQQYMQVHTPPSFWQQYGSWVGYAAAASVSTVMAFLYVNQLSQNDHLVADVKHLKSQIEVIQNQPAPAMKADTIYVVQTAPVRRKKDVVPETLSEDEEEVAVTKFSDLPTASLPSEKYIQTVTSNDPVLAENKSFGSGQNGNLAGSYASPVLGSDFLKINTKNGVPLNNSSNVARKMDYELANHLSTRQVQKSLNPGNALQIASNAAAANTKAVTAPAAEKKVEQTAKAENVIPKLNLKVPYRFGGGIAVEGNGQAKTVVAEVLIAKKFSITAGINWLKVKPMEFFTEKIFREKNRQDFKRSHPGEVPLAFDVYNIKVNPTLVQIPLTVAFRNTIKDNWAYYAGVGTNINVSAREKVSFDCRAPNNEFFSQGFDKKTNIPAISSVNFSMGLEKTWHPIVVQAEGYLYTYFTPLTPLSHSAGPGVKVKLLYQIGGKM